SRPSTPATTPAPWSRWGCPTPRCAWTCACSTSTAAAGRCGRPGTATACPPAPSLFLIDLYLRGRYDLDRFVSETIALDQVEEAFAKMQRNEVLRSVVVFPDA